MKKRYPASVGTRPAEVCGESTRPISSSLAIILRIVAELTSVFLGQELGFTAHTLELNAAYLYNWLRVLRSDKNAIFKHAADAQRACDYLIARSDAARAGEADQAA